MQFLIMGEYFEMYPLFLMDNAKILSFLYY